jgi:hypothetical protein
MDDRCLATRRHQASNLRLQSSLSEEMIERAPRVLQGLMDALRASSHLRATYQLRGERLLPVGGPSVPGI